MRKSSYEEMTIEYNNDLDSYKVERNQLLSQFKYSVILEGESMELQNLEKWIIENTDLENLTFIYYDKTDYNYFFVEYFFTVEEQAKKIEKVIPKIFTTYPKAFPSQSIIRTNGNKEFIDYSSEMLDAIIF